MLVIGTLEDGQQPEVIPLRDGIKLVVMALGTLHGQPEDRPRHHLHLPVNHLDAVWNEEQLLKQVDEMAALVQTHALVGRRGKARTDTERVRCFIHQRRAKIMAAIDPAPPSWPWPLSPANICLFDVRGVCAPSKRREWESSAERSRGGFVRALGEEISVIPTSPARVVEN